MSPDGKARIPDRVFFVDNTLREGEQTPGVSFSLAERIEIVERLDDAGLVLADIGMPVIRDEEVEAARTLARLNRRMALGVSARLRPEEVDLSARCEVEEVFLIVPTSAIQIRYKLQSSPAAVADLAVALTRRAVEAGMKVNLVAEDATRSEPDYLGRLFDGAAEAGARRGFVCDTVGTITPTGMRSFLSGLFASMQRSLPLGVHCHNDFGLATANTVAAIEAGAEFPSVTVNGIGERTGNAPLHEAAMVVDRLLGIEHGIRIESLLELSRLVESASGIVVPASSPIVGDHAFKHESGIHIDGTLKRPDTYEPFEPGLVGQQRSFVIGKHSGRHQIEHLLKKRDIQASPGEIEAILKAVKARERGGRENFRALQDQVRRYREGSAGITESQFWDLVSAVISKTEGPEDK